MVFNTTFNNISIISWCENNKKSIKNEQGQTYFLEEKRTKNPTDKT